MGESISYLTSEEKKLRWKIESPIIREWGTPDPIKHLTSLEKIIDRYEELTQQHPHEWLFWYVLSDMYPICISLKTNMVLQAVRAGERCYQLRPHNIRSLYAYGNNVRLLLQAKREIEGRRLYEHLPKGSKERSEIAVRLVTEDIQLFRQLYDASKGRLIYIPRDSYKALEVLGWTLDQAAETAIRLYEAVLGMASKKDEIKSIRESLAVISNDFPHIRRAAF